MLLIPGMYAMLKGAPFIITDKKKKEIILKLGNFGASDFVCDLGCGDGSLIGLIADRGVKNAVGYEFSIPTYLLAKLRGVLSGSKAKVKFGNFWKQDFSQVDVIVCFLLNHSMRSFEKNIWPKLHRGTRVISNSFKMDFVEPEIYESGIYLYRKK